MTPKSLGSFHIPERYRLENWTNPHALRSVFTSDTAILVAKILKSNNPWPQVRLASRQMSLGDQDVCMYPIGQLFKSNENALAHSAVRTMDFFEKEIRCKHTNHIQQT